MGVKNFWKWCESRGDLISNEVSGFFQDFEKAKLRAIFVDGNLFFYKNLKAIQQIFPIDEQAQSNCTLVENEDGEITVTEDAEDPKCLDESGLKKLHEIYEIMMMDVFQTIGSERLYPSDCVNEALLILVFDGRATSAKFQIQRARRQNRDNRRWLDMSPYTLFTMHFEMWLRNTFFSESDRLQQWLASFRRITIFGTQISGEGEVKISTILKHLARDDFFYDDDDENEVRESYIVIVSEDGDAIVHGYANWLMDLGGGRVNVVIARPSSRNGTSFLSVERLHRALYPKFDAKTSPDDEKFTIFTNFALTCAFFGSDYTSQLSGLNNGCSGNVKNLTEALNSLKRLSVSDGPIFKSKDAVVRFLSFLETMCKSSSSSSSLSKKDECLTQKCKSSNVTVKDLVIAYLRNAVFSVLYYAHDMNTMWIQKFHFDDYQSSIVPSKVTPFSIRNAIDALTDRVRDDEYENSVVDCFAKLSDKSVDAIETALDNDESHVKNSLLNMWYLYSLYRKITSWDTFYLQLKVNDEMRNFVKTISRENFCKHVDESDFDFAEPIHRYSTIFGVIGSNDQNEARFFKSVEMIAQIMMLLNNNF